MSDEGKGSAIWPREGNDNIPFVQGTTIYGQYHGGTITPEEVLRQREEALVESVQVMAEWREEQARPLPVRWWHVLRDALLATRFVRWLLGE